MSVWLGSMFFWLYLITVVKDDARPAPWGRIYWDEKRKKRSHVNFESVLYL